MIYLTCVGHIQEMCRKCHLRIHVVGSRRMHSVCPVRRKCVWHTKFPVYRKCASNVTCLVLIFSFMPPNLFKGNVPDMSCVLATGNVPKMSCVLAIGNLPEILPYTVPGNVKKMSKFPGVGNVHTMNRKCELSCRFHGISWPRKFRISSSATCYQAA